MHWSMPKSSASFSQNSKLFGKIEPPLSPHLRSTPDEIFLIASLILFMEPDKNVSLRTYSFTFPVKKWISISSNFVSIDADIYIYRYYIAFNRYLREPTFLRTRKNYYRYFQLFYLYISIRTTIDIRILSLIHCLRRYFRPGTCAFAEFISFFGLFKVISGLFSCPTYLMDPENATNLENVSAFMVHHVLKKRNVLKHKQPKRLLSAKKNKSNNYLSLRVAKRKKKSAHRRGLVSQKSESSQSNVSNLEIPTTEDSSGHLANGLDDKENQQPFDVHFENKTLFQWLIAPQNVEEFMK